MLPHGAATLGNDLNSLDNCIIVSSHLCLPYQTILSFIHLVALYAILWQLWRGNRHLKYIKGIICLFPDAVKALRNDKMIKFLLSFLLTIMAYIYFLPQNRHCVGLFTCIYSLHADKKKQGDYNVHFIEKKTETPKDSVTCSIFF